MTATPFETLTAMWQSGAINDEEFKLATKYLKAELGKKITSPDREVGDISVIKRLAGLLLPAGFRTNLSPMQLWSVEIALFLMVAGVGVLLAPRLLVALMFSETTQTYNLHPLGAAGWTVILLAVGGVFVGYNRLALLVLSLPLFLMLLLAPLWSSSPSEAPSAAWPIADSRDLPPARTLRPRYSKIVTASELGAEWPFPAYRSGIVRCDEMTIGTVKRPVVTIELGGQRYGLNGAGIGWGGFGDSRELMAKHPEWGTYELGATSQLIAEAVSSCG